MIVSTAWLLLFSIVLHADARLYFWKDKQPSNAGGITKLSMKYENELSSWMSKNDFVDKIDKIDQTSLKSRMREVVDSLERKIENVQDASSGAHRFRRDADNKKNNSKPNTGPIPTSKEFYLNGTENSNEAYMYWAGTASDTIYVLTRQMSRSTNEIVASKVWRSVDYGASYKEVAFPAGALITYFFVSPANYKKAIFSDYKKKTLYITTDELSTTTAVQIEFQPDIIVPHPTRENWFLGYWFIERKLYYSTDTGKSWSLVHSGVSSRHFWGTGPDDEYTVHLEIQSSIRGNAHYKKCNFTKCADVDIDKKLGSFSPVSLYVWKEYVFVEKVDGKKTEMYVSYNRKEFRRGYFPPDVAPKDFIIVNADEGQVFLAVSHQDGINLYLSDATGQFYVPTLKHIVFGFISDIDLHEVKSLKGTYLANQKLPGQSDVITYISYDKGGQWHPVPLTDQQRKACGSDCSLHLHLDMGRIFRAPGILSEANAPGIILAHGNIGKQLSRSDNKVFVSRDGGWTWKETGLKGFYRFNILDQGSILTAIMELTTGMTNQVYYSYDQGDTWHSMNFIEENRMIQVDGVLNEPGITSLLVSIYGHAKRNEGWRLITLNFTSVLPKKCSKSDFEIFTPKDSNNDNCTLGQTLRFERRKQFSVCSYGQDYMHPVNHSICTCSFEDYECDFGYVREGDEKCQEASWFNPQTLVIECKEGQTYNKSSRYRKVASDKCTGGIETTDIYRPLKTKCPTVAPYGVRVTADRTVVATRKNIVFELSQSGGSEISTVYTWNFGDKTNVKTVAGLNNSLQIAHQYAKYGRYNVTVEAKNSNGSTIASAFIRVEDEVTQLHMDIPWATITGKTTVFDVVGASYGTVAEYGHTHFMWLFDVKDVTSNAVLTWNRTVGHIYNKPGKYHGSVETINSVSSIFKQFDIIVFDAIKTTTVVLEFPDSIGHFNLSHNLQVRVLFVHILERDLVDELGIQTDRFVIHPDLQEPFTVHLTFFPGVNGSQTVQQLADRTLQAVSNRSIAVALNGKEDLRYTITVSKAYQLAVPHAEPIISKGGPNYKPVYIAIPVLIAIIAVSLLVVVYYKRRFRDVKRYTLLRNRRDEDNHLLGDDDDDDPPLDLNPDFGVDRNYHDDQLDLGNGSHLVMVTGERISDDD